jgi:hypothetical protein
MMASQQPSRDDPEHGDAVDLPPFPEPAPNAALERQLIAEFLAAHGHTLRSVTRLPAAEREQLLRDAAACATLRLAEIEARAHLIDEMREG